MTRVLEDLLQSWLPRKLHPSWCNEMLIESCQAVTVDWSDSTTVRYAHRLSAIDFATAPEIRTKHTHTHPFNSPLSGTTKVSRYQKGKTNLNFAEARESEWQWHQLGHMQVCTLHQTQIYFHHKI